MRSGLLRYCAAIVPLFLLGAVLAQDPPAKPGAKKPPMEEEEAPKSGKKPPKGAEEEAPKPKKPVPKDDEEEAPKPKKPVPREDATAPPKPIKPVPREDNSNAPVKPGAASPDKVDLAAEAARATHPDVKKLFQAVALQADYFQLRKNTELLMVAPVPEYVGAKSNQAPVRYQPFGPDGKLGAAAYTALPGDIVRVESYEEHAVDAVANFVIDMQKYPAGNSRYLSPTETLGIADKVLTAVHSFHESARASDKRKGAGWDAVRGLVRAKFLDILSDELRALIASTDKSAPDKAADVAFRIGELFPDSLHAQREIEMWKLSVAPNDLLVNDAAYFEAAQKLHELTVKFATADPKVLEPLRDSLRRRSQAHFEQAKRFAGTEDGKPAAIRQVEMAVKIWPELPGLREYQQSLARDFRLLVIGVKQLPELMSPGMAVTDADRWACELLFEGLVKTIPDGQVGQRYVPGLALRLPRTIAMGREFELPRDAVWVDRAGQVDRLDSSDVRSTLAMLQEQSKLPIAEDLDLLSEPSIQDAYRFPLRLERGTLDPLNLMSFKVMPGKRLAGKPEKLLDREFALNPVGSGPFIYFGRKIEDGREYSVFKSNPQYSKRTGRFGRPRVQEIRFVVAGPDAAADLRDGRIDVLLDVSTEQMMQMRDPKFELSKAVADYTVTGRHIWMLAVNHRKPNLGQDVGRSLRRAVAYAISREELLKPFRAGTQNHAALHGPFPPGTWAVPETRGELFRLEYARNEARNAKTQQVSVKFVDSPLSKLAVESIKKQVAEVGIELTPVPLSAADFHKAVMIEHDYDLAYMPYDYASEMYSLRGLFDEDAMGRGERNFLGYRPDAKIGQLLTKIHATRDFTKVRDSMHLLYTTFEDQMPFIPLWQLNFHLLMSRKVDPVPAAGEIDPLTIFDMIEEWRINR